MPRNSRCPFRLQDVDLVATMASLQVRADVLSAEPCPNAQNSNSTTLAQGASSSSLGAIQSLFDTPRGPEPARKRRRVENGHAISVQPQSGFEENESIVLAKVSLELVGLHLSPHGT
jgi:hypothetical protein